ncbi:hypothetical protein Acsp03_53530 [Actinomadura sp. NBRC 104412]|uniref:SecDF P1 head subdomain-containing protein n=1 Tax=Actinomadura sp. NBRC 104412 TaxID=3032203 RepID=UPI0024A01A7A|nr:hypothetical protein [Actinomadura sp. NBRC 104412]GLZ07887.1 hypothetical protein Acsp03_53530 [Actinomadura sp. NBRC 104412]
MAKPPSPGSPFDTPPPGYGPPPPVKGPAPVTLPPRNPRITALVAGAMLLLLIAGATVVGFQLLQDDGDPGPVDLRQPLLIQQVAQVQPPPCPAGMLRETAGTECFKLEPGGMTVRRLEEIRLVPPGPQGPEWGIALTLTQTDAAIFGNLTIRARTADSGTAANRIAMVVGDVVVSAPTVTGVITGGQVQISGRFDRPAAERLIERLTGRPPS